MDATCSEARRLKADVEGVIRDAEEAGDDLPPALRVELVDNELARVYMNSASAQRDHPTMPVLARQALGLARRLQDPALEFAAAHNQDEDLLCVQLHPNQNMVRSFP